MTSTPLSPNSILRNYYNALSKERGTGQATEHSYRSAFKAMLEALGRDSLQAVNEPSHTAVGAPDFIVQLHGVPVGHVECKDIGENLDNAERTEQLNRYLSGLPNLLLTDYLDFRWYVDGELRDSCKVGIVDTDGKLSRDPAGTEKVATLLDSFFHLDAPSINNPRDLARRMAASARLLREGIAAILEKEDRTGALHIWLRAYREALIEGLSESDFADMQAQTFAYGLFAARCRFNRTPENPFTREAAVFTDTTPFLSNLFLNIAGPNIDSGIRWIADDLALLLDRADMSTILNDFGNPAGGHDPVIHFYEDFLHAYDPRLREMRGVYYTPQPVVSYIVRSINALLQERFGLSDGLADSQTVAIERPGGTKEETPKVIILDPAAGTGTFLQEVVASIRNTIERKGMIGAWPDYVSNHLLPRLFGFELLMAPYAICHLKLSLEIAGATTGVTLPSDQRINVFLTNALEEPHERNQGQLTLLQHAIAQESASADAVKREYPVMVVLGNPPYSGHSANKGNWIRNLLRGKDGNDITGNYFQVDGSKLEERNPKWLNDDYVKFIRYAQRRIEIRGEGVIGFVTNHSYLDNPTFRGMRQNLMETFDEIYLLDLHGNSKKKERTPDGGKDENVFDIQQGVAIGLFVKHQIPSGGPGRVFHADLYGERGPQDRGGKYQWLAANDFRTTDWVELRPKSPHYMFIPRDEDLAQEYGAGWSIPEIFPVNSAGVVTARDKLTIHWSADQVLETVSDFAGMTEAEARSKYQLGKDSQDWKIELAQDDLNRSGSREELVKPILYRPFDARYTYYTGNARGFICRPRKEVMRHMVDQVNLGLITTRQCQQDWDAMATRAIIAHKALATYDLNSLFPLYTYPTEEQERMGQTKEPNLSPGFISAVTTLLQMTFVPDGSGNLKETVGPEDLFHYIYAVLHSPEYRRRYGSFLRSEFARVPVTTKRALFTELVNLGQSLTSLHLMEGQTTEGPSYPVGGDNRVDEVRYAPANGEKPGRVYINKDQYFEGIPTETWNSTKGGYRPADKWLRDRKGQHLGYDDVSHYRKICAALIETNRLMRQVDQVIDEHGGWPLK